VEENRGQGVISRKQLEEMKWCRCSKVVKRKAAYPTEGKAQQSGIWPRELEDAVREKDSQREVGRTFQMLREVWLNIGVEKLDTLKRLLLLGVFLFSFKIEVLQLLSK